MSDTNINRMDLKQLRNEVQLLRDELAIFKRKYEDAIHNLDSDNFGKSFTIAQNNMKTQIQVTAEAVKSTVSKTDLNTKLENYSKIEQTADAIRSTVSAEANLKDAILLEDVDNFYDLSDEDVADLNKSKVYKTQRKNEGGKVIGEKYYYYNSLSAQWELISGDSIYTLFQQTDEGFLMKGNTVIDGSTTITRNLKLSGNITWDMSNSPVQSRYSSDGVSWHTIMVDGDMYMQMSFDGGHEWSDTLKVVATESSGGGGGIDEVTAEMVFDALTNGGENQGLFSAFYEDENKLFINAEYIHGDVINANTARVANELWIGAAEYPGEKRIHFSGGAHIGNLADHTGSMDGYGLTGLMMYGTSLHITVDDMSTEQNNPLIMVNEQRLATQDWVRDNVGTVTYVAVFGE